MNLKLPYLFVDLDETLVHSIEKERLGGRKLPDFESFAHGSYVTFLRPEAPAILGICREWAQEVVLFTFSEAAYAREISQAFGFGFAANQVFGCELFVFGEKDLSPTGALIDDLPPGHENARLKMRTLGIGPERYLQIPSFGAPKFAPCRTFLLGLPYRLEKLAPRRPVGGRVRAVARS